VGVALVFCSIKMGRQRVSEGRDEEERENWPIRAGANGDLKVRYTALIDNNN